MEESFARLRVPQSFRNRYPAEENGLFDLLRSRMTDEMLLVIARCDYENDVDEHLVALKDIRDGRSNDQPLKWHPHEVLSLTRWGSSDNCRDTNFHLRRAFAAATLRRISDVHENHTRAEPATLAALINSCEALGHPFIELLYREIVGTIGQMEFDDEDYLYNAFGLLAVYARSDSGDPIFADELANWVIYAEEALSKVQTPYMGTMMSLRFGDSFLSVNLHEVWKGFVRELKLEFPPSAPIQLLLARL